MVVKNKFDVERIKFLKLLSKSYPNVDSVSSKIIDLKAVLNMPKATEHFVSDIHGEFNGFYHVINNASGVIKNYIIELFDSEMNEEEKSELATVIYYPELKLENLKYKNKITDEWLLFTLKRLIEMTRRIGSKYNREKVVSAFPKDKSYILQEIIFENPNNRHKKNYYNTLLDEIINLNLAESYIIELSKLIKRFAVEYLHVLGDVYDRGDESDKIMDFLISHHNADIQWGNHDIAWLGAYCGCEALIANVVRIAARYDNLSTLEDSYGINLIPLMQFAEETYKNDPCEKFIPKTKVSSEREPVLSKIHKAISIIQFKSEIEIIKRHPEFKMEHRMILDKISKDFKTVTIEGINYELSDNEFPTLKNSVALTEDEKEVIEKLKRSFKNSTKLANHMKFMVDSGSMYNTFNDNLLFHGCIPLDDDGKLKETEFLGEKLSGKALLDVLNATVRNAFYSSNTNIKNYANDIMWYLWCGSDSPLFGKSKMTTFERYFIEDESSHEEPKNPYYKYRENEEVMTSILKEFGIESEIGKIVNGHVPVKAIKGENPIKSNGKLIAIDGGFSKAYQKQTGIAGYTLISNSYGLLIATHEPFIEIEKAIETNYDITSKTEFALRYKERRRVISTDMGKNILERLNDLNDLLFAYRNGIIEENK